MQLGQVTLDGMLVQNEQSRVGKLAAKGTNWLASTADLVKSKLSHQIFVLLHIDEAFIV